jgi:hypothetical protein
MCSYDQAVDVWALGINFLLMQHGAPVESASHAKAAASMIKVFGLIPASVVDRFQWSVPNVYISNAPQVIFGKPTGGSLEWAAYVTTDVLRMCQYDPTSRVRAADVVAFTASAEA